MSTYYLGRALPRIVVIPDAQVKPGVNTDHLAAAGRYCAEKKPDIILCLGDWWDMPSLSVYEDKGSKYWHDPNRTYKSDIQAGNDAMDRFMAPILAEEGYEPRLVFVLGNHEYRIERAVHADPVLEGALTYDDFNLEQYGWEVHPFLKVVEVEGILVSHYFCNPQSLKKGVLGGTIDNRLNKLKRSFIQGHQQVRQYGSQHDAAGQELHGLVVGAFYSHDEEYAGPQGNHLWRGMAVLNEARDGAFDIMFVSLNYLLRECGE